MPNIGLIGLQWGDEGKGKIIDFLVEDSDIVVRYQGGNNAGHTVYLGEKKIVLHLIPSGILHKEKICVIGNGVVIDVRALFNEIEYLKENGIEIDGRLKVADNAHVLMPYHRSIDQLKEKDLGDKKIGTTGRGIGPCYVDKYQRIGIRIHDICSAEKEGFKEKLKLNIAYYKKIFPDIEIEPFDSIYNDFLSLGEKLRPLIVNPVYFLAKAKVEKNNILFEGAQGSALDIDFGTYPYVTSSNPTAGGICSGAGVGPSYVNEIYGVTKAYCTRVGGGPFPSEVDEAMAEIIRKIGGEFGATTGRPRRCGWIDAVQLRYACLLNSVSSLVVTKLDVLDTLKNIKIVTGYKKNGQIFREFPSDISFFNEYEPVLEEWPGWLESTKEATKFNDLPDKAKNYLGRIEELSGVKIKIISIGAKREQTFKLE